MLGGCEISLKKLIYNQQMMIIQTGLVKNVFGKDRKSVGNIDFRNGFYVNGTQGLVYE